MKLSKKMIIALLVFFPISVLAKTLNLHETPQVDSKIIGNINTEMGVMPIFTPKGSNWVKVADPSNGNVGWVESKELNQGGFQFNVINSHNGKQFSQTIQYSGNANAARQQIDKTIYDMQKRYEMIERDMHKLMQDMFASNFFTMHEHPAIQVVTKPTPQQEIKK